MQLIGGGLPSIHVLGTGDLYSDGRSQHIVKMRHNIDWHSDQNNSSIITVLFPAVSEDALIERKELLFIRQVSRLKDL